MKKLPANPIDEKRWKYNNFVVSGNLLLRRTDECIAW
jgi:hypothetical protein